jgi:elongation of very long chain fatty acids protein 6
MNIKTILNFNYKDKQKWMNENWTLSIYIVVAYLAAIVLGRILMENRRRYNLKVALFIWNSALSVFSISGTLKVVPEMYYALSIDNGLYHTICSTCDDISPGSAFWAWLFVLSKVAELGDTSFIILRKRPLLFLHWYHHITVLLYTWYSYAEYISPAKWFVVMNYFIHSFMYTYYTCKTLGFRLPRFISMIITTLQLLQMVIGVMINVYAYAMKTQGYDCLVSYNHINIGLFMYFTYFMLFIQFFYKAYVNTKR